MQIEDVVLDAVLDVEELKIAAADVGVDGFVQLEVEIVVGFGIADQVDPQSGSDEEVVPEEVVGMPQIASGYPSSWQVDPKANSHLNAACIQGHFH